MLFTRATRRGTANGRGTLVSLAAAIAIVVVPFGMSAAPKAEAATPASISIVSGNSQSAAAGRALSTPLMVMVRDAAGNPAAGVEVTWSITGAPAGANGQ